MERYLPAALARNPKLLVAAASFAAGAATTYVAYTWSARAAPTTSGAPLVAVPPAAGAVRGDRDRHRDGGGTGNGDRVGDTAPPAAVAGSPPHAPGGEPAAVAAAVAEADVPAAGGGGGARAKAPLAAALPRPITSWVVTRSATHGLAPDKVVRVALEWARRDGGDAVFSVTPAAPSAPAAAPAAVDGDGGDGAGGDAGASVPSVVAAAGEPPPLGEVVYSVDEAHLRWLDAVVALGAVGSRSDALHRVLAAAAAADDAAVFGVIRCRTDGCAGATVAGGGGGGASQ